MAGKNRTRQEKLGCMLGGRRVKSERHNGAATVIHARTLLVGHNLVVIYRLKEMG